MLKADEHDEKRKKKLGLAQWYGDEIFPVDEIYSGQNDKASKGVAPRRRTDPETSLFGLEGPTWSPSTFESPRKQAQYQLFLRESKLPIVAPSSTTKKKQAKPRFNENEPRSSFSPDKPNLRHEAIRLERKYADAMRLVERFNDGRAGKRDVAETIDALFETSGTAHEHSARQYLDCRGRVDAAYDERSALTQALKDGSLLEKKHFSYEQSAEEREILAKALYEQNLLNTVGAELATQVTVGCLEHGRLLEKLKERWAINFEIVSRLHSNALWQLDDVVTALSQARTEANQMRIDANTELEDTRLRHETVIKTLQEAHAAELAEAHRVQDEQQQHALKMGDTMRVLNGLYRDMQYDADQNKVADLHDKTARLQERLDEAHTELETLRPLRHAEINIQGLEQELKLARDECNDLRQTISDKDALLVELTTKEAKRLEQQENRNKDSGTSALATAPKSVSPTKKEENDHIEEMEEARDEKPVIISTLCVRCKKALDDAANIRAAVEGDPEPPRLVCQGYRVLLPKLASGERPTQSPAWTRRTIRAILQAMVADAALREPGAPGAPRIPEFVYSYFEPSKEALDAMELTERRQAVGRADDERWALYYGCKLLKRESDEAKLFWDMLDEIHGSDFTAFTLFSLATARKLAGPVLRRQLGVAWASNTSAELDHQLQQGQEEIDHLNQEYGGKFRADALITEHAMAKEQSWTQSAIWRQLAACEDFDALAMGGQQAIWIGLDEALEATERVLLRANGKLKRAAIEATRGVAVESDGRLSKWMSANKSQVFDSRCVDLSLWLRILTHLYREEQAHRRAAVRLMFETALAGTVAARPPDYGPGREPAAPPRAGGRRIEPHEPPPSVDLPQFVAIVRTLWPSASMAYSCSLYRKAHESNKGKVDYEAFLQIAEKEEFFTASLALPQYQCAMPDFPLPLSRRSELSDIIRVHSKLITPLANRISLSLPDAARARLAVARDQLEAVIKTTPTTSSRFGAVSQDGIQALAAYRHVLAQLKHARLMSYELGRDYPEGAGDGFGTRLITGRLSSAAFLTKTARELESVELALLDFVKPKNWQAIERLRRRLAVYKIQLTWRRRVACEIAAPLKIRLQMRRGYLRGRGNIRDRRVFVSPANLLGAIDLLYEELILSSASLDNCSSFPGMVYASYLARLALPSLADRAVHDLYLNARNLAPLLPRARIFCLFSGLGGTLPAYAKHHFHHGESTSGTSNSQLEMIITEHAGAALRFYLDAVLTLRSILPDAGVDKAISPLFPEDVEMTSLNHNACTSWEAQIESLEKAIRNLLGNSLNSQRLELLMGQLQALATTEDQADVDDFLYLILLHWARILEDRRLRAAEAIAKMPSLPGAVSGLHKLRDVVTSTIGFNASATNSDKVKNEENDGLSTAKLIRRDLEIASAFTIATSCVESGKLPPERAYQSSLESFTVDDITTESSAVKKKNIAILNPKILTMQFYSTWSVYETPIDTFLDDFETRFPHGAAGDALEDTRIILNKTKRNIERARDSLASKSISDQFQCILDLYAQLRTIFESVNNLLDIQRSHTHRLLRDGTTDAHDVHSDLVPVPGWDFSWEFLRDEWYVLSSGEVLPRISAQNLRGSRASFDFVV